MKDFLDILLEEIKENAEALKQIEAEAEAERAAEAAKIEAEKLATAKEFTIFVGENLSESFDTLEKALGKAQMTAAFRYDRIVTLKQGNKVLHRFWQGEWKKF